MKEVRRQIIKKILTGFVLLTLIVVNWPISPKIPEAQAATSGTTRLYLHSSNISEENSSHSPMLPSVFPDADNANGAENNTGGTSVATPCRDANFATTENMASINEETDSSIYCVATFFTPIIGANVTMDSTDTNSLSFSTWAAEEGGATTPVFRSQLYEYVEGDSSYVLVDQTDDNAAITNTSITNYTWTGTPCNQASECGNTSQNVVNAGNRLALIIIIVMGTGEDTGGGTDTIDVSFSRHTTAPAYMELSYTLTMEDKPSLAGANDDDFDEDVRCTSACDATTLGTTPTWTIQTSGNTTTETVDMGRAASSAGSSQWLSVLDVKTADLAATTLANYTYVYQSAPAGDGDVTTQVTSTADRVPTTDPRNFAGLVLGFSSDTDFLVLQSYYDGANVVVEVNDTGVLSGTTATITGNANNILLRWSKSGTSYQAKYCAADVSDCTVAGNWTSLGSPVTKSGTFNQMGVTAWVEWVTTTNTQYAASFEWFDSALVAVATITQNNFEFWVDNAALTPTDIWGNPDIAENVALNAVPPSNDPIDPGDEIRIRMNMTIAVATLAAGEEGFIFAYSEANDCTTASSWTDVDVAGGAGIWIFSSDTDVTDNTTLTTLLVTDSDVAGRYNRSDPTTTTPNAVTAGQDLEWDWHIVYNSSNAAAAKTYCFRIERDDGSTLNAYNSDSYPRVDTRPATADLMRHGNFFTSGSERGFFWAD